VGRRVAAAEDLAAGTADDACRRANHLLAHRD
jgi:hypothetical protein